MLWRRTWIWPPDLGRPQNHLLSPAFDNTPFVRHFCQFVGAWSLLRVRLGWGLQWVMVGLWRVVGWLDREGWDGLRAAVPPLLIDRQCQDKTTTEHLGFARSNRFVPWESLLSTDLSCPFFVADRGQHRQNGSKVPWAP